MNLNLKTLQNQSRLLLEAELTPLQGTRFQPTGFPELNFATYDVWEKDKKVPMVLVESAQSVANRLETTIWDEGRQAVVEPLAGIPYIVVEKNGEVITNSLLEAHRLNSSYIIGTSKTRKNNEFFKKLQEELEIVEEGAVNLHKLAGVLAKYDINCLLHGIFLSDKELAGGRFRLPRSLSGFIEARNIDIVSSGGVKNDRVDPTGKKGNKGGAKEGFGNVPFPREECAAEKITAYFNLDLNQIRSYRLGEELEELLIAIAIWKIQEFLAKGLRLRTACDLDCLELKVQRPQKFKLPKQEEITKELPKLIKAAAAAFADPAVTVVPYQFD